MEQLPSFDDLLSEDPEFFIPDSDTWFEFSDYIYEVMKGDIIES